MRISLVTGAASGIGAALVRELLRAGDTVVATDVDGAAGAPWWRASGTPG